MRNAECGMRNRARHAVAYRALFCAMLLAPLACSSDKNPPPVAYTGPTLTAADLGGRDVRLPATGYTILQERSQGRFPGALGVAFIDHVSNNPFGTDPQWQIANLPEEDGTWWNQLFNTVPPMREVLMMDAMSVITPTDDVETIVHAANRLKMNLCLIYARTAAQPLHAALIGTLYDTNTRELVAVVRADAGPEDFGPPREDTLEEDYRHCDADYLVKRRFEQQARACVLDLISRDQPLATTQPSAWSDHGANEPTRMYIVPDRRIDW